MKCTVHYIDHMDTRKVRVFDLSGTGEGEFDLKTEDGFIAVGTSVPLSVLVIPAHRLLSCTLEG